MPSPGFFQCVVLHNMCSPKSFLCSSKENIVQFYISILIILVVKNDKKGDDENENNVDQVKMEVGTTLRRRNSN